MCMPLTEAGGSQWIEQHFMLVLDLILSWRLAYVDMQIHLDALRLRGFRAGCMLMLQV